MFPAARGVGDASDGQDHRRVPRGDSETDTVRFPSYQSAYIDLYTEQEEAVSFRPVKSDA